MTKILLFFLFSSIFTQIPISTKEFSFYKSNDDNYIDFADVINDLNGQYSIELIKIDNLQFNKKRKTALENCELEFNISSNYLNEEPATKTLIPKKKSNVLNVSLCNNKFFFENNKLIFSNSNSIIMIDHEKYDHLSCSLTFWITGKFSNFTNNENKNIKDDGVLREWYDNENIYIEYNFKNGKKNGIQKRWHPNGHLDIMYFYKKGKLHGEQKRWFENGNIKFITHYSLDKLDGLYSEWYSNGQLKEVRQYKDNNLVEILESYDNDGKSN